MFNRNEVSVRKFISMIIALSMICTLMIGIILPKNVLGATNQTIKILEITDTGSRELNLTSPYEITTMSMKKFVALREELGGKYDVIYIGSGKYSTAGVQGKEHNTKGVMNDITNLKAIEIKDEFIKKGQIVILHQDIFKQKGSKLYNNFTEYNSNTKSNVKIVNNLSQVSNILKEQSSLNIINKRPVIKSFTYPSTYTGVKSTQYQAGQSITFTYTLADHIKNTSSLNVKLYIDANYNKQYDTTEMITSAPVTSQTGTLEYLLPPGYSGLRFWKLEIEDAMTGLKDYKEGVFKFTGEKVNINVLQIKKNSGDAGDLPKLLTSQHFGGDGDYKINIEVTDMNTFNNSIYKTINGKYDMLIFGFADSYNSASISDQAARAVEEFIQTGQSVMFTHDTIFQTGNNWVKYFMDDTGQLQPQHDLGYGAPNQSNSTKRVNDGLILQYPNKLSDDIQIATTHNQYYTLDLEDPSVIPWYNIIGSNRDVDDSWNHFYTYSKGTVTYSGTGHTNNQYASYPNELRLFVNTMYMAFFGANHAPSIQLIKPKLEDKQNKITVKNIDAIDIEYIVKDLDLKDATIDTKIYFDKDVVFEQKIASGSTITQAFNNPKPLGGNFIITIEATDNSGAKAKREIQVEVEPPEISNMQPSRNLSKQRIEVGQQVEIIYTINFPSLSQKPYKELGNIQFVEKIPAGLEVIQKPDEWKLFGDSRQGFTINTPIQNISYKEVGTTYVADPISFKVVVKPIDNGLYWFDQGTIKFNDLDGKDKEVKIATSVLTVETRVTKLTLDKNQLIIKKDLSENLHVTVYPEHASNKSVKWVSSDESIVTVEKDSRTNEWKAIVKGHKKGQAKVTVVSLDNSKITDECTVEVVVPVVGINIDPSKLELKVGESSVLQAIVITEDNGQSDEMLIWKSDDSSIVAVDSNGKVTALAPGKTVVTVATKDGKFKATCDITVIQPVTGVTISPSSAELRVAQTTTLQATVQPENATNKNIVWTSNDEKIAEVDKNGVVTALSKGEVVITVTTEDGGKIATCDITVKTITEPVDNKVTPPSGFVGQGYIHPLSYAHIQMQMLVGSTIDDTKLIMEIPDIGLLFDSSNVTIKLNGAKVDSSKYKVINSNCIQLDLGTLSGNDVDLTTYAIETYVKMKPSTSLDINKYNEKVIKGDTLTVTSKLNATVNKKSLSFELDPYQLQLIKIPNIN